MAEAALSKSLDEIIAEQRKKSSSSKETRKKKQGPKRSEQKAQQPPEQSKPGKKKNGGGSATQPRVLTVTIKGNSGISKRREGRRKSGGPIHIEDPQLQNPELRLQALEGNAKWGHDMFVRAEGKKAANPRAPHPLGTKLDSQHLTDLRRFITNLHYEVSEGDIKELFSTCGEVVRHSIMFDDSGRSKGEGFVVFQKLAEAQEAMQRYNGVALDGQEMKIELIPQRLASANPEGRVLKSGIKITGERTSLGSRVIRVPQPANVRGRGSIRSQVVAVSDAMQE